MLTINNICKRYDEKKVLNGVTITIPTGSIYGLIGKNGAGKTTLMSIVAGLQKADSGTIEKGGRVISYLPDIPGFYDYLTCKEYLNFLLADWKGDKKERSEYLLSLVSLDGKTVIKNMSRGMKQRLGIAASLVNNPDIILFDEPTSALDPAGRIELMEIIVKLKQQGKTIVLSTHILADMEKICDEVGFLHDGIIKKSYSVKDLEKDSSFIVEFKNLYQHTSYCDFLTEKMESDTIVRFELKDNSLDNQKRFFTYLGTLDNQILSIKNEVCSLDELFKEICGV